MGIKERIKNYYKKKSLWSKITDFLVIALIIAMLIPSSRLAVGGFINRIKAAIMQPRIEEKGSEQVLAPDDYNWPLNDINKTPVNLNDFKGKVLFINVWATWCPPCVGEMPEIQGLYDRYKNNDQIAFLLISNEENQTVKNFLQKRKYSFPVYTTKYRSPDIFYSQSIPVTFLISKTGKMVIREEGASNWNGEKTYKLINQLINE
jgi:thiol-disulfide isomerase/thioredoxin